jgi:4,4'-diaponeurosporenoate glycosyltransferase
MTTPLLIAWFLLTAAGWVVAARFARRASAARATAGRLSIIIPARNEAHNLPQLLASISSQNVRPHELIVVDDASTDRTAEVARTHGATVIASAPLPDGWRGKTWACHQGASAASGELLCFMDADTWFEPGGLAHVLAIYPGGALSVLPYHAVRRPYEDLSMFFNISMAAGTVPDGLAGQFLLVGRAELALAGGHEAVKGKVLENFRLAGMFRAAGIPVRCASGRGIVSFRMYPQGLASLIEGWTKGFAAGAGHTPPLILALVVAWMSGLMLPPLCAVLTGHWPLWLGAWVLGAAQLALIARRLGAFGWANILLYPLPLCFFFAVFAWSAMRSGKKVSWKGREIHAD